MCLCAMLLPLQSLGQRLLQVGGGCWEGELDCNAAAVVEDSGEVISFRGRQDGQLIVRLTCRRRIRPHTQFSDVSTLVTLPTTAHCSFYFFQQHSN